MRGQRGTLRALAGIFLVTETEVYFPRRPHDTFHPLIREFCYNTNKFMLHRSNFVTVFPRVGHSQEYVSSPLCKAEALECSFNEHNLRRFE